MCGKSRKLIRIDHQALWASLETWRKELCEVTVGRSPEQPLLSQRCVPTPHLAVSCHFSLWSFYRLGTGGGRGRDAPSPAPWEHPGI